MPHSIPPKRRHPATSPSSLLLLSSLCSLYYASYLLSASSSTPLIPVDAAPRTVLPLRRRPFLLPRPAALQPSFLRIRGGDAESASETEIAANDEDEDGGGGVTRIRKRRKRRRKRRVPSDTSETTASSPSTATQEEDRKMVDDAIQKDAAAIMGDAIRARSKNLLQDDLTPRHPKFPSTMSLKTYSSTYTSLRYALGSSDRPSSSTTIPNNDDPSGSVPAASGAVIANYFLQSHGGAHSIQSIASLLAVLQGFTALSLVPSILKKDNTIIVQNLTRRCLLCGMAKHLSGLVALACEGGSRLGEVGWRETQRRLVGLVEDPIAQYLCYCALMLVWTYSGGNGSGVAPSSWWMCRGGISGSLALWCILGPVLLREVVSTLWVISDVLVLLYSSSLSDGKSTLSQILSIGRSSVDALMSLLLGPDVWRNASASERQRLLAKLVGHISLAFEVGTAVLLLIDAGWGFLQFSLLSPPSTPMASTESIGTTIVTNMVVRPTVLDVGRRLLCTRLYINFMLVRKRKVKELMGSIRGGALYVPGKVLDTLLEPGRAMGFDWDERRRRSNTSSNFENVAEKDQTPLKRLLFLLGF